jgi:hypothetical protein
MKNDMMPTRNEERKSFGAMCVFKSHYILVPAEGEQSRTSMKLPKQLLL